MAHNPHINDSISDRGNVTTGAASADFSAEKNGRAQSAGHVQGVGHVQRVGRAQSIQTVRNAASDWGVRLGALAFWLAVWQVAAVVINQDIV